nr:hypothetical protein BaRGS_000950 [Batillaria attramentaria]
MVWAGFTYDHKIALEVIDGNMTAVKYRDDIIRDVILPFKQQHPVENFILVDDNATSHRASIVQAYKNTTNIVTEDWPARSPDLNVIEHVWTCYRELSGTDNHLPTTWLNSPELFKRSGTIWISKSSDGWSAACQGGAER